MNHLLKLSTPLKSFIFRSSIFILLFILVSGIIGPWVISTRLLYGFYFFIYGNLGKLIIFTALAFIFYVKQRIQKVQIGQYKMIYLLYIVLGAILISYFFSVGKLLLAYHSFAENIPLTLFVHFVLILISALLILGVFGPTFVYKFISAFKKELFISILLAMLYDFAIFYIWNYWALLSTIVLHIVAFLFSLTFKETIILPPYGLYVRSFVVQIEAACSGLDSLFLFSSLYCLIGLFEWNKIIKRRYFLLFFPAIIGLFMVNILRVYTLIWVGIIFSPYLTLELFHTYLGMVLFIIYFLIFMRLSYKSMMVRY